MKEDRKNETEKKTNEEKETTEGIKEGERKGKYLEFQFCPLNLVSSTVDTIL